MEGQINEPNGSLSNGRNPIDNDIIQTEQKNKIVFEDNAENKNDANGSLILNLDSVISSSQKDIIVSQLNELNEIASQYENETTLYPSLKLCAGELDSTNISYENMRSDSESKVMIGMTPRSIASWALGKKKSKDDIRQEISDNAIDKLIDELPSPSTPPRPQNLKLKPKEYYQTKKTIEPNSPHSQEIIGKSEPNSSHSQEIIVKSEPNSPHLQETVVTRTRTLTAHQVLAPESTFPGIPMHMVDEEIKTDHSNNKKTNRFSSITFKKYDKDEIKPNNSEKSDKSEKSKSPLSFFYFTIL